MKYPHLVFTLLLAVCWAMLVQAQHTTERIPQGIESLRLSASSKTEFTLDHSMLVLASKLDPDNEDLRRVIAGINGVSVHSYHYPRPWMYEAGALASVKEEYSVEGWKHVMNTHEKDTGTDVWLRWDHNVISNVAILVARANEVDYIVVSGSVSPIDLSHLGGHFGIPKIEAGVTVPNESPKQQ
jgi:Domain of unknown function (DUF4252)